jgi:hypothetical protein
MSAADRFRYALAAVAAQVGTFARKLSAGGRARDLRRLSLERIIYPDSACAQAALDKLNSLASPALINHSLRSYVWGSLLGQLDGKSWDAEVLYVAMMLHDLGLTTALHGSCRGAQCFTLDSVDGASEVLNLASEERAERMRRAVLLHLNVRVPGEVHGWEAHYVQAGASLDIIGRRYGELPRETVHAALALHPRLNLKEDVNAWLRREARLRPSSRMAMLVRLDFCAHVQRAPFAS